MVAMFFFQTFVRKKQATMENSWKKIGEWAQINSELEKIWAPGYELYSRRAAIEREIPWLKGHGANPSGPSPGGGAPPPPLRQPSSQPPAATKIIVPEEGESSRKKKKSKTQKGIEGLPVMVVPPTVEKGPLDLSDTFQGNPDRK